MSEWLSVRTGFSSHDSIIIVINSSYWIWTKGTKLELETRETRDIAKQWPTLFLLSHQVAQRSDFIWISGGRCCCYHQFQLSIYHSTIIRDDELSVASGSEFYSSSIVRCTVFLPLLDNQTIFWNYYCCVLGEREEEGSTKGVKGCGSCSVKFFHHQPSHYLSSDSHLSTMVQ